MDRWRQNEEVIKRGGGSPQARFYRGDYDWMFEREEGGEESECEGADD